MKIKKTAIIISLLFLPYYCFAASYFSYVTDIERLSGKNWRYSFILEYWKVSPYDVNPCKTDLSGYKCYLSINHLHSLPNKGGSGRAKSTPWKCDIDFSDYSSLSDVYSDAVNLCGLRLPFQGTTEHHGEIQADECIGFFLNKSKSAAYGIMVSNGICGIAPPPTGKCYFAGSGRMEIDHGLLSDIDVDGDFQSSTFEVICNQPMTLKIRSNMDGPVLNLRPDGSIGSEIKINNIAANIGSTIRLKANDRRIVNITSKLITSNSGILPPGKFSGVVTLVLTIP